MSADKDPLPLSSLRTGAPDGPVPKLTDWANEPTLATMKADIERALPMQKEHMTNVDLWLDNMHLTGSAKVKPAKGRSSVQPKLIRKQAEWRYGALSEPFLTTDKLFSVKPRTFEDGDAAVQNELVLNWQFSTKLNPVELVDKFVRKVVDEGTVALRVGWIRLDKEEEVDATVWDYYNMTKPEQVNALTEATGLMNSDPRAFSELSDEVRESVRYSAEVQMPMEARKNGTTKVKQMKMLKNEPICEVVNLRNLVVDPSCGGDQSRAMFMSFSDEISRAELEADSRYKNLDRVNWGQNTVLSQPDHVQKGPQQEINFTDEGRRKVVMQQYWGYYDIHKDNILKPFVAYWIGDVIVRMEENPFPDGKPPFVLIPYLPIADSVYGEPDGELLEDNQKILGAVTRGIIDMMAKSANGQRGMAKNMLDTVNKRRYDAGQDYEYNPGLNPQMGIVEHKYPEIPASAMNMISMQNMEAESLTGVKMFSDQGISGASLGPTAAGARGALDASSKREMGILRRLAKGMAIVGGKIVAMNQEFMSEQETVRVTNEKFVKVKREELQGAFDMQVDISTAEEDNAKAGELAFMLQTMGPNMDIEMTKLVMVEIARLRRMPALANQFKNYEPKPDPLVQRKLELEVEELAAKAQKLSAEAMAEEAAARLSMARARLAEAQADLADLDYVEQDTGTKHARDLQKGAQQANANQNLQISDAILHQKNGSGPDGKVDDTPTKENIEQAVGFQAIS